MVQRGAHGFQIARPHVCGGEELHEIRARAVRRHNLAWRQRARHRYEAELAGAFYYIYIGVW